jgi:hypothetical protein
VAAADGAASAKLRRKRKEAAAAAAASGGGVVAGAAPVAWANPKVQPRAYQAAWLAFLQGDLPGDIYRKVCASRGIGGGQVEPTAVSHCWDLASAATTAGVAAHKGITVPSTGRDLQQLQGTLCFADTAGPASCYPCSATSPAA